MKKTYQRLPESELDIMLVLWNNTPPMTRPEIEKVINMKKKQFMPKPTVATYRRPEGSIPCEQL